MSERPLYVKEPGILSYTLEGREAPIPGERVTDSSKSLAFWFDMEPPWEWADGALIDETDRARLLRELPAAARISRVVLWTDAATKRAMEQALGPLPDVKVGRWSGSLGERSIE